MHFSVLKASVLTRLMRLSPVSNALLPTTDLLTALGAYTARWSDIISQRFTAAGANGETTAIRVTNGTIATTSGGAVSSALIPAGSLVLGVTVRVVADVTGAPSFDVGTSDDTDRWGASIPVIAGSTSSAGGFTAANPVWYPTATAVQLTTTGANFSGGSVRVAVHYITLIAPIS